MDTPQPKPSVFREAHLRDYWKVVWQGRFTVLAVFFTVVVATAVWTFLQTPVYRATAIVEVQPKARSVIAGQDASGIGAVGLGWFAEERYHNTQVEIIKSRDIAKRVIRLLGLEAHPAFAGVSDPVEAFRGRIQVNPRRQTGLIEISIMGPDRDEITQWVNAVAQAYVSRNLEKAGENVDKAMSSIRVQIASMQEELSEAERERLGTLQDTQIFNSENRDQIIRQKLEQYNTELTAVRIELSQLNETLQRARELNDVGASLMSLSELAADELLRELSRNRVEAERTLEGLRASVKPGHPEYERAENELENVSQRIGERVGQVLTSLDTRAESLRERMEFLQAEVVEAEQESLVLARATSQYEMVRSDSDAKRGIFDMITKTLQEVQLGAELMTNNVQLLDEAIPPRFPVAPRKRLNLMVGSMFGLFLGLGLVFFFDYLDNTIRTPEDVEKYLGLAVLGVIPKVEAPALANRAAREAYQSLRTSIIFSSKNRTRKRLLITSTGPQEGKSSTVSNLARTLAAAGERVVIVDCDLRRPTQHEQHGLERDHGLTNYLASAEETPDWKRYVKKADPPTLDVLTCGPIPPNPPDLIGSGRFRQLMAALHDAYDWVLVDSPPASSLADASLLASVTDMIVVVVQHNRTDRDLVVKTVQQLRGVNPSVAGVVLNNVNLDRAYGKDYYYAGYYYQSADESAAGKKRAERKAKAG